MHWEKRGPGMNKKEGNELFRGLREGKEGRKDSSRLEDFVDEIEASFRAGVSRPTILATLHKLGFTFQMNGFISALQRIRKKRAATKQPTQHSEAPKPTTTPQTVPQGAPLPTSPPKPPQAQSTREEEEEKAYEEFKKSVAHLSIVQRSKKLADFLEKQAENRPSYNTRKLLGEKP
jgi:hypothetical protein